MKEIILTISSKNQITLPAKYVRELHLAKNRHLTVSRRGDRLTLRPQAPIREQFADLREEAAARIGRPLNDEELNQAIRDSFVIRWNQNNDY